MFVFSSLLEVPALCLLPSGVAHRRLEGARPKRSRSTTFPRKSARSWPQQGSARETRRRRTARQLQLDGKYFMPPSLGFWPLEIHIIQHMSSADGKNIATFFIRSFGAPQPPKAMLKARTPLRDGDSSRLSTLPLGGGGGVKIYQTT